MARKRVAVLISGRGSNMAALIYAARAEDCPFEIALVSGDRPEAPGLALAEAEGVPTAALDAKALGSGYWPALQAELERADIDLIALAGFMRLIPGDFIAQWDGAMVNIHPSLLPAHKGLKTHEAVLAAGEKKTGATVHLVTADLDSGASLGQVEVAVLPGDTAQTLAERVLIAEHQLYPRVLAGFIARESSPDRLLQKVRAAALSLTEVEERASHGSPAFFVKGGKVFAYFSANHHGDGKVAMLVKIDGADEQAMLIEQDSDRYYRPAYFGDNWVGVRLDLPDTDWSAVEAWLARSWRAAAPARLTKLLRAADEF